MANLIIKLQNISNLNKTLSESNIKNCAKYWDKLRDVQGRLKEPMKGHAYVIKRKLELDLPLLPMDKEFLLNKL